MDDDLDDQIEKHANNLFQTTSMRLESLSKLIVLNKLDLVNEPNRIQIKSKYKNFLVSLSCLKGLNIQEFLSKLIQSIAEK